MPEINLPTKAGQDEIKTLAGTINTNVDSVKTDITAVNSNVNTVKSSIGTNSDTSSATGSVHGKLKDIKGSVGTSSDTASSTGSIHGKLKELRASIGKDYSTKKLSQSFSGDSGNIFSITGAGVVNKLLIRQNTNYDILVDGVMIFQGYRDYNTAGSFDNIYFSSSFTIRVPYGGGQSIEGSLQYALK